MLTSVYDVHATGLAPGDCGLIEHRSPFAVHDGTCSVSTNTDNRHIIREYYGVIGFI